MNEVKTVKAVWIITGLSIGIMVAALVSGCAQPESFYTTSYPTPSNASAQSPQQTMVDTENAYRASVGQEPYVTGLSCTLYTVPTSATVIIGATLTTVTTFTYHGVFNQPNGAVTTGFNVLPAALQSVYQTWFIVKCSGVYVISDSGYRAFDLTSDDGSNLYVDGGSPLINNDGLHGAQTKSNVKMLKYGFHTIELDFMQANGSQALILNESGSVLSNVGFYH